MIRSLAIVVALAASMPADAQVYKCTINGKSVYSDRPCATTETQETVKIHGAKPSSASTSSGLPDNFPSLVERAEFREAISKRRVMIGMEAAHVRMAWGAPTKINRSIYASGVHEQWVYHYSPLSTQYVHLRDGVVTSITE